MSDKAKKSDDMESTLETEQQDHQPADPAVKGGLGTTDPAFAEGGMEVDSMSNQPHADK